MRPLCCGPTQKTATNALQRVPALDLKQGYRVVLSVRQLPLNNDRPLSRMLRASFNGGFVSDCVEKLRQAFGDVPHCPVMDALLEDG